MNPSIEKTEQSITPGTVLSRQLAIQQERYFQGEVIEIRDHQKEAMSAISTFLVSGEKAGHVEMATATGKSYLIANLAQAAADLGMRTLILAPTLQIAKQLDGEDGHKGLGKFTDLHKTGRTGQRYGNKLSTRSLEQPVVITTYQSLNNLHKAGLAPTVDLIIADEAHRSLGEVTSQTMEAFSPNAIKIGFTATPSYSEDKSLDQLLPEKIFSLDIRDSVERGLTPPISSIIYETGDEIPTLDPNKDDFSERELSALITLKARNEAIVTFSKNFVEAGMQGAVACLPGSDLAHPRLVADELNKVIFTDKKGVSRNIRAVSVGNHRIQDDNQRIIDAYDNGDIDVLTFVYSLEQGWDSERPQFMINASPTTSSVRETQLLGRLLRGDEDVFFVDFLDIAKKRQYTSLHVLGEEKIEAKRRVGGHRMKGFKRNTVNLGDILDGDLYKRLQLTEGKLLSELYIGKVDSETDRLMSKWNRVLEKEGLGETLPGLFAVNDFAMRAFLKARIALGEDASVDELAEYATDHQTTVQKQSFNSIHKHISTAYLEAINKDQANIDDYEVFIDHDVTPQIIEGPLLKDKLISILDSLSEREAGVISMRFGLYTDGPRTLDEIGDTYGVTGERIRLIEKKTMDKLKHASRSGALIDFMYERALQPIPSNKPDFFPDPLSNIYTIREKLLTAERQKQYFNAINDVNNGKTPIPLYSEAIQPLETHLKELRLQADQDKDTEDLIVGIEGYLSGLYTFRPT